MNAHAIEMGFAALFGGDAVAASSAGDGDDALALLEHELEAFFDAVAAASAAGSAPGLHDADVAAAAPSGDDVAAGIEAGFEAVFGGDGAGDKDDEFLFGCGNGASSALHPLQSQLHHVLSW